MRKRWFRWAPGVLWLLVAGCIGEEDQTVIKLGHGLDPSHPVHGGMAYMAQRVAEKSGGRMRIDIYPSQQLGTERENMELLQIGSLGMTKVSSSVMENFAPSFQVLNLPYLFRDDRHLWDVLESEIGQRLLREGESKRLRGLAFYDAGSRSFYTKTRSIEHPSDLQGLKIRVQESPTSMRMVTALGGSPTPISWGELYTALQQGVVDGAENNPPSFYTSRHYEVAPYYSLNQHTYVPDVLVVSTVLWNRLAPEEQRWLEEAARESVPVQRRLWAESEEQALEAVQRAGVRVTRPDRDAFAAMVRPMIESFRGEAQLYGLIQEIESLR